MVFLFFKGLREIWPVIAMAQPGPHAVSAGRLTASDYCSHFVPMEPEPPPQLNRSVAAVPDLRDLARFGEVVPISRTVLRRC